MSRRGKRSIVAKVLSAVLLVIVVFAIVFGVSAYDLANDAKMAADSYNKFDQCANDADFEGAISAIHDLSARLDVMGDKVEGVQWKIASSLPIVSDDVKCVRGLVSIGDSLANDALMPVLTRGEGLMAKMESANIDFTSPTALDDAMKLVNTMGDEVSKIPDDISHAREVVKTCEAQASALPDSHIEDLNNLKAKLRDATKQANEVFETVESLPSLLSNLPALLGN